MPELLFHGAAGEVTGSMHMIRAGGRWLALECGLFQGRREESEAKNRLWPMPPKEISAVILSHAHIDHTGRLPKLVRDGFNGPVYCTTPTRDLCAIMLPDSAHIQQEDIPYVNKRRARKGLPPVEGLYDYPDAVAALKRMRTIPFDSAFEPIPGVRAYFNEAGHMLGSAGIHLTLDDGGPPASTLYFSGDVGRPDSPILRDPAAFPECDTLVCESTYGGRINETSDDAEERMIDLLTRTFGRGGRVIIPAFSVGRTQTIVYFMHRQMVAGRLPKIPIFVDSPLAVNATDVFKLHPDCYDAEARAFHMVTGDILGHHMVTYIRDVEDSKKLNFRKGACVIIAASGMCEAGRVRHHLRNNLSDRRNAVLLPGFQAMNTLGRKLADGAPNVNIFHDEIAVRAEVVQIHGFSGHADQADLLKLLRPLAGRTRRTFLVHGEPDQSSVLVEKMNGLGFGGVAVANRGQRVTL
jgi:metallo-beta-lactamase family protein